MTNCNKKPYRMQWQAELARRAISRRLEARPLASPTGIYLWECRRWHLTSKSNSQKAPWVKGARSST